MKTDALSHVERLYEQSLEFLQGEGPADKPAPGPTQIEYQNSFRASPEKYLLKDNLLLLLRDV